MTISAADLADFIERLDAASARHEQALNAADARLGDGDTGSMLKRILAAMVAADARQSDDLPGAARRLAQATMKETGSSLGTLVATALMTLARQADARGGVLAAGDMADATSAMADAVAERGRASAGDKTVLDSLRAVAEALRAGPATQATAASAARAALEEFRGRPCRIGRARMFPERSMDADDPGMLAGALLLDDVETIDAQ